ncbi:MAG: hypothetical protein ACOX0A_09590 [Thermoguttaceae bacterium]|jgi:hypothetical protein
MARFLGFLVQALLVGLSFWLNMLYNQDVLQDGLLGITAPATATEDVHVNSASDADYRSNYAAGQALNAIGASSESSDDLKTSEEAQSRENMPAQQDESDEAVMNSTVPVEFALEEESRVDESVSPKGGKHVSIPSFDVDALRGRRAADDRIIGVTKAEITGVAAPDTTNRQRVL